MPEGEAFYRQMFERNRAVQIIIDPRNGNIVNANPSACEYYGYTPEKLKTLNLTHINVMNMSQIQERMRDTVEKQRISFQTQHRLASDEIRDVEVFVGVIEFDNNNYLHAIIQDITDRVKAEKALRQSEKSYNILTRLMPDSSVIIFDKDMRYTFADGSYLKRFGSFYENIVGKLLKDVLSGTALDFLESIYARALQGESFTFERVTDTLAYEAFVAPIPDENGQIVGGMLLSHDITRRIQSEKALRESERIYRTLVQHMPNSSMVMFDTNLRYTLMEGFFLDQSGYTSDEMLGKTPSEVLDEETANRTVSVFKRALQGESFDYERVTDTFAYDIYVTPIYDTNGQISGGIIFGHNNTQRVQADKALRESERLYRTLVQHMPNSSVVMFDTNLRYTLVEGLFLKQLGLSPENMLGKTPYEILDAETADLSAAIFKRTLQGETFSYDQSYVGYAYTAYATPLYNEDGTISGGMVLAHDTTTAKRAEAALRESETHYRTLVDFAPVGIIQADVNGKRTFCNARWCEMAGIRAEDALTQDTNKIIYPEDQEFANRIWDKMVETHLPFENAIFRYQRPDNRIVWVSGSARPIFDAQGIVTGYIATLTDITERKQLENALRTSETRFRAIVNLAPVGIFELNKRGEYTFCNSQWSEMSGVTQEEAISGKTAHIHPDDILLLKSKGQQMLETGTPMEHFEYRYLRPDGSIVWVSNNVEPIFNESGVVSGYIGAVTDISVRLQIEEALRLNEERLQLITDNIQDVVTQTDSRGNFVYVSASSQSTLGYAPEELYGKNWTEFIHLDDQAKMKVLITEAVEKHLPYVTVEGRFKNADGRYLWMEDVIKFLFDDQSNIIGEVFICRDITERKRLQDLLLQKEKLLATLEKERELNDLKTRMMQRITHEFRTPLSVIQTASESLAHYHDRLTDDQRSLKVNRIMVAIRRVTDMLDEIGMVIKGTFTPDRIHKIPTDLSHLCREAAAEIETTFDLPEKFVLDLPETVHAPVDPQVLKDALAHIMRNAARFSKPADPVHIRLTPLEHAIEIRVTDTGIGILPQELARIFEPFFRGSNIGETTGLGVGLPIARAAIEAHNGTIRVESIPNQGTTVTISLPF